MTSTLSAEAVPSTDDRPTGGRFAVGNRGGPGNPFARQTAALRAYLINHVTERDIQDILDILLLNAKGGHLPTVKFLFSYVLGKPKPVVEPDMLDLQEMQMLQQSAQPPEALETLCDQLPLDLQVQLARFGQDMNQAQATREAQATLAAEENAPSTNGNKTSPTGAAPSTDGNNSDPQTVTRTTRPSTNGKTRQRPRLPGFDWLRELREAARPPGRSGRA